MVHEQRISTISAQLSAGFVTIMDKNILAIIPARGGSKSIEKKNLRPINGKPLIAHTICAARESRYITRLVVSTDDDDIALASHSHGAEVIKRPPEISGDFASSELALLHVLSDLEQRENYQPDLLVFLQCTSPLTSADNIDDTIEKLLDEEADTAFTAIRFHYFIWREQDDSAVGVNHDKGMRQLRQARNPEFLESGNVYVMRVDGFKQAKHRFFGKTVISLIARSHCFEIDQPVDFDTAEKLLASRRG